MDKFTQFFPPILLFLLTLVSGFRLSRAGQPYNGVFFNTHKLLALVAVGITIIRLFRISGGIASPSLVPVLLIAAAVCVLALFTSGALMSTGKADHRLMLSVHRIATAGLVAASALYLLAA